MPWTQVNIGLLTLANEEATEASKATCIYNWFYLKTCTIYNTLNILPSGIWIQSKEIEGSRIAGFDCVLLLCYPGCKCSDSLVYFLSKSSRLFQCTWRLLPLWKKWYWSRVRSKWIWELHKSSTGYYRQYSCWNLPSSQSCVCDSYCWLKGFEAEMCSLL